MKDNHQSSSGFSHQDFKPITFHNKKASIQNTTQKPQQRIQSKPLNGYHAKTSYIGSSTVRKLDNSTSATKHKSVSHSFSRALQKARGGKHMTQLDLANALHQPLSVIKNYESGKAIPNGNLIHKMNTVLGVKLPSTKTK